MANGTENIQDFSCFKSYDIRGKVPSQVNEKLAEQIGRAYAKAFSPKKVAVGYDIRLTSLSLTNALIKGFVKSGVDVLLIGECGTEQVYHAAFSTDVDGGVMVTASHNPKDYNGFKFVGKGASPLHGENGLELIRDLCEKDDFTDASHEGTVTENSLLPEYIQKLLSFIDVKNIKPFTIVAGVGNGGAFKVLSLLEKELPCTFIALHPEADGNFPNGVPNPLLEENRLETSELVKKHNADFAMAWDGDFDRCFFFDEKGEFVDGYYVVGLLAEAFLVENKGAKIIHDPRLIWNTIETVENGGGHAIQSKTGHAFIKESMRKENAVYGGEMSAHHYFRDFGYCDSGMIPWLLLLELLSKKSEKLSNCVAVAMQAYPISGEINRTVTDAVACIASIEEKYKDSALNIEKVDGLSMSFADWRFNVRSSQTEPLLRLNIETRAEKKLLTNKTTELLAMIAKYE